MPSVGASTAVLVTGATGFIGRQVLRHLLDAHRSVIAIARPREDLSAHSRVLRAVGHLPDRHQLEVIEADLTNPHYGLTSVMLRRLRDTVETVIHCAVIRLFSPPIWSSSGPDISMVRSRCWPLSRWDAYGVGDISQLPMLREALRDCVRGRGGRRAGFP